MNNPPVTWLMPVRNGMPCIRETLASIAAQHYDNHRLLVWDNGSTDGTIEELRQWVPSKIPGRIVHNQPMGLGSSLAALVRQADTEYCARIDADDINRPERLVRQVTFLEEHPAVGIVGSQAQAIDEKGSKVECRPAPTADAEIRWRTRWLTSFFHPSVLFRRSVVLAAGNYRNLKPYEDQELWIRMSNITEMRNLPEQLIEYRRTQTSVTGETTDFYPGFRGAASHSRWNVAACCISPVDTSFSNVNARDGSVAVDAASFICSSGPARESRTQAEKLFHFDRILSRAMLVLETQLDSRHRTGSAVYRALTIEISRAK